jgi:mannose-6-phosphate isomerase-like protein (cupin superfamily)
MSTPVAIHPPAAERILRAFGDEVHVYLSGNETGGRFAQARSVTPPGGGPPPHWHTNEDEWFYVLSGTASFFADGAWRDIGPGSRVFCPRMSIHTFRNNTAEPLEMLVTTSPAGFEDFFAKCAAEFASAAGPDMGRIIAIAEEHGIHFATP